MKISFKGCLEKKKIFRFEPAKQLVGLEIEDAESDLRSAQEEFSKSGFKWATIKGYYSMFHSAGHYFTLVAIGKRAITVFTLH